MHMIELIGFKLANGYFPHEANNNKYTYVRTFMVKDGHTLAINDIEVYFYCIT